MGILLQICLYKSLECLKEILYATLIVVSLFYFVKILQFYYINTLLTESGHQVEEEQCIWSEVRS